MGLAPTVAASSRSFALERDSSRKDVLPFVITYAG